LIIREIQIQIVATGRFILKGNLYLSFQSDDTKRGIRISSSFVLPIKESFSERDSHVRASHIAADQHRARLDHLSSAGLILTMCPGCVQIILIPHLERTLNAKGDRQECEEKFRFYLYISDANGDNQ
jgi:hypothetical protein